MGTTPISPPEKWASGPMLPTIVFASPGVPRGPPMAGAARLNWKTLRPSGGTRTPANNDMEITDSGNVMFAGGAERPGIKLQVNGGAAFGPMGSGGEVAFGSP